MHSLFVCLWHAVSALLGTHPVVMEVWHLLPTLPPAVVCTARCLFVTCDAWALHVFHQYKRVLSHRCLSCHRDNPGVSGCVPVCLLLTRCCGQPPP